MPKRVLIVEDERIIARDLQQQLRALGYDSSASAGSSEDSLRLAAECRPDVVLMDVGIKGSLDGVATAELMRERFDVPVVFVTAHADDETLARATSTGSYGYLLKPIKPSEVKNTIELALVRHAAERELRAAKRELERERDRSSILMAQLRAAVEHLTCGVGVTDSDGLLVVVNQPMLTIFRADGTPAEAVGRSAFELIFKRGGAQLEDPAGFRQRILEIASEARPVRGDRVAFRDGRIYERDFMPAVLGDNAVGHVWCYYDVTGVERQRQLLVQQALRDPLTGIANRAGLELMLERRIFEAAPFALLFIDLDGFKGVNDRLGHAAGDALLQDAAARLRRSLRATDDIARFAGDEFVGIAAAVTSQVVPAVLEKVRAGLSFEVQTEKGCAAVSASVGCSLFPDDGRDASALLRKADESMYEAKLLSRHERSQRP